MVKLPRIIINWDSISSAYQLEGYNEIHEGKCYKEIPKIVNYFERKRDWDQQCS